MNNYCTSVHSSQK